MTQPSTPTHEYGAPALPVLPPKPSARGRCVFCVRPISDDQEAVRFYTEQTRYSPRTPVPWRHVGCTEADG